MELSDHPFTWIGAAAMALALLAWLGDWRRRVRKDPDAVGWVPWTTVSFCTFFAGAVLLVLGVKEWV